jgi:hypothetical protein
MISGSLTQAVRDPEVDYFRFLEIEEEGIIRLTQ